MKKFLISTAVATSLLTASAFAAKSANNVGDFLIAPAYYADGSFSTTLKLVNTDLDSSVIVRGVIRERVSSEEIDFIILLSPGDVWEGKIYQENGVVYLQSSDDSNYMNGLANPVDIVSLHKSAHAGSVRDFTSGYVEFYPVVQYNEGSDAKVDKSVLQTRYDTADMTNAATNVENILYGVVRLDNDDLKAAMALPMTALADVSIDTVAGTITGSYPTNETNPDLFIDTAAVYDDLLTDRVIATYSNAGQNNNLYFTFWNDRLGSTTNGSSCTQYRQFSPVVRDMEENRFTPTGQPISPAPITSPITVSCEHGVLTAAGILSYTNSTSFDAGQIQINSIKNVASNQPANATDTPSAVVTQMSAAKFGDQWSFNWNYVGTFK